VGNENTLNEPPEPQRRDNFEAVLHQLRHLNVQQSDLLSVIKADAQKKKDFWDVLPAVSGFLATVGLGVVVAIFTHAYNEQQVTLTRLDILEKFVPDLTSADAHKQDVSLSIIRSLRDTEFEAEIAADVGSPGAVTRLTQIAVSGSGQDRAYAIDALTTINPLITIPELAKIAVSGSNEDRVLAVQTMDYLSPHGIDELATVATTGSAANRSIATQAINTLAARGIDVSEFNGRIDWTAVAKNRIAFGIVRLTYGTKIVDPSFASNWAGMKTAGIIRGAYHVFAAKSDATEQANAYLAILRLEPGDLPPLLDCEDGLFEGADDTTLAAELSRFLDIVQSRTGRVPIVYASPKFFADHPIVSRALNNYPIWVASVGNTSTPNLPGWDHWTFWQYSFNGKVNGITTDVDLNIFDGSIQDLDAFVGGNQSPTPTQ
jgi:GH25 family lysozyme M1 (1,4-beta-N-acetylmuramidase)